MFVLFILFTSGLQADGTSAYRICSWYVLPLWPSDITVFKLRVRFIDSILNILDNVLQ